MKIRKAILSDIPIIKEIAEKAWRPTYDHILTEQQTLYMLDLMYNSRTLENQINGNIEFFMVDLGQETIGYFAVEECPWEFIRFHIFLIEMLLHVGHFKFKILNKHNETQVAIAL